MRKPLLIAFLTAILLSGLTLVATAQFSTVQASAEVTGIISSNTTWTKANSPYSLTGPVKVNNDVTLTIEAGATVNLNDYYIQVEGTLRARGSSADQIHFNSGSIKFMENSNDWNEQTGTGCVVENAVISSTNSIATVHIEDASPKINNDTIEANAGYYYAIEVWGGSPTISNSTINGPIGLLYAGSARSNSLISDNIISGGGEGIEISCMGTPTIERNVIMSNNGMGIYLLAHAGDRSPIIRNNTIAKNSFGIKVLYRSSPSLAPIITLNNFQDNNEYNVYFDPDSDVGFDAYNLNATYNWWGTTDPESISQSIYDFEDNFNLGNVTFVPFLTEPNPNAPAIPTSAPTPTPTPTPSATESPMPTPTPTPSPSPIPVPGQSFFFVTSNSTVSELFFNSTSAELSFTVSGPSETAGYVEITIAISLLSSVQNVKVYLDGSQLDVAITEDGDAWLLSFTYMHSTHYVMVSLAANEPENTVLDNDLMLIAVVIVIAVAGVVGFMVWRKKKKT